MIERQYALENLPDLEALMKCPEGDLLFFDIETTGLSPFQSEIYLIGAAAKEGDSFVLRQWFSESFHEESALLEAFLNYSRTKKVFVSFNGDTFDIRFIKETADQYAVSFDPESFTSVDLYKAAKRLKPLLGLENARQKTVESFLHIGREDLYTGGELISLYDEYRQKKRPADLETLLLHNKEDVEGLVRLSVILSYDRLIGNALPEEAAFDVSLSGDLCALRASFPFTFPSKIVRTLPEGVTVSIENDSVSVDVPAVQKTLRRYYDDYKNYYYLPNEGYAVHKKIASFMDPESYVKATRETAFTLHTGLFIPWFPGCRATRYHDSDLRSDSYLKPEETDMKAYFSSVLKALSHTETSRK